MKQIISICHSIMKSIYRILPLSGSHKELLKNFCYGKSGGIFKHIQGYQNWQVRQGVLCSLFSNTDSGLSIPDDIPLTTVIIPACNLKKIRKCLTSIRNAKIKSPFEIIIIDGNSHEDITTLCKEFPGIRMIHRDAPPGFLSAANRGAEEAKGEYLLFLNGNTEVLSGWLDELAVALYKHPEAGMIGSQIIHGKTGKLYESGNLICRNGEILPLGYNDVPEFPEFNYFREVDFSSAVSIMLRRKLFLEFNSFDEVCGSAYPEEADFALKLQRDGYRNYVMPLSRVFYHGSKHCSVSDIFFKRWGNYLASHSLYDKASDFFAMRKYSHSRIFYLDAEVPMADRGSGGMDAIFFMEYMKKRGYDVVFHGEYTPDFIPKYTPILLRMGVECVYTPQRQVWKYLEQYGYSFDYLFVSRVYQAQCFDRLFRKYCRRAVYIFNTVDIHFVREELEAQIFNSSLRLSNAMQTKRVELLIASQADATIVISRDEKKLLEETYGLKRIMHIPQARTVRGRSGTWEERKGAVFIGSAHLPNVDGLLYFYNEILPLLPADFELTVIGEALRDMVKLKEECHALLECGQIKFAGFVSDLADYLDHAKMTIAPLRYGAGTKGKVASSMSYGVPCVSTSFGTQGTDMQHDVNVLIADTPRDFARCRVRLDTDFNLWMKLSDGGIDFLTENYAPEKVASMMDQVLSLATVHKKSLSALCRPVVSASQLETISAEQTGRTTAEDFASALEVLGFWNHFILGVDTVEWADYFKKYTEKIIVNTKDRKDICDVILSSRIPEYYPFQYSEYLAMGGVWLLPLPAKNSANQFFNMLKRSGFNQMDLLESGGNKILCCRKTIQQKEVYSKK